MLSNNDLMVQITDPLINVMKAIEEGIYKIAIVVDNKKKVVGTITDGDIRRGLLKGNTLNSPIGEIMNKDFKFITDKDDIQKAKKMLNKTNSPVRHLPVLNSFSRKFKELKIIKNKNLCPIT